VRARLALLVALVGVALAQMAGVAAAQTTHYVGESGNSPADFGWDPPELEIATGDTVRWCFSEAAGEAPPCNDTAAIHDVHILDEGGDPVASSPVFGVGGGADAYFEYTFDEAGTFTYVCQIHPSTMVGTLTVSGGGGEDVTPPTTTILLNGADPVEAYDGPVEVTLEASDNPGGSGLQSTEYALDGGDFVPYEGPFTVSEEGEHTIQYRSTDVAGNVEETREVTFTIDPDGGGGEDPAALATTVKPKNKRTKVGRKVAFRVQLANTGELAATDPKVCLKAPRNRVKLTNGRCWTLSELAGGEQRSTRFELKAKKRAAGKRVKVKFVTSAEGIKRQVQSATLRVAKKR
jgi:plastocyanin